MFGLTLHDVATAPHPIGIECERCIRRGARAFVRAR